MTLTSSIPVLRVGDYPAARAFMENALGFSVREEGGDPARFGIFARDKATVFVDGWQGADPETTSVWRAYFHVSTIDELVAELKTAGVTFDGPKDTVYGMREIEVTDPSGNRLCFGQDI